MRRTDFVELITSQRKTTMVRYYAITVMSTFSMTYQPNTLQYLTVCYFGGNVEVTMDTFASKIISCSARNSFVKENRH